MAATATHDHHPVTVPEATVDVRLVRRWALLALVVGVAGYLICGFAGLGQDSEHGPRDFFLTYLCGYMYWFCVPFGALGLSMIGYLTSASWGIVFRRIFQAAIRTLPVLFVLGLPVIASLFVLDGKQSPYWWSDRVWNGVTDADKKAEFKDEDDKHHFEDAVQKFKSQGWDGIDEHGHDKAKIAELAAFQHTPPEAAEESLHKIHDWLNPGFFALRYVVYFAILGLFAYFVLAFARPNEDRDDPTAKRKLHDYSAPGIVVFVLTLSVFATDWVMSVEPSWASSMFPVVFGMNMFLTTLTFSALVFYTLVRVKGDRGLEANRLETNRPDLSGIIKDKFRIDIGSLTLGFCMVWSYASFCQFMLVWAGNLPEEIPYYLKRGGGERDHAYATGWIWLSYFLMLFHWLIPFVVLLFREVKTNPHSMRFMAGFLMTVCAADVIWWILPSVPHPHTWTHFPMAVAAILGVGGLWGLAFCRELAKRPILPTNNDGKFLAAWGHH
jgi:phage shock protein PspC (stress-responsive transcriptional regulator)